MSHCWEGEGELPTVRKIHLLTGNTEYALVSILGGPVKKEDIGFIGAWELVTQKRWTIKWSSQEEWCIGDTCHLIL